MKKIVKMRGKNFEKIANFCEKFGKKLILNLEKK